MRAVTGETESPLWTWDAINQAACALRNVHGIPLVIWRRNNRIEFEVREAVIWTVEDDDTLLGWHDRLVSFLAGMIAGAELKP